MNKGVAASVSFDDISVHGYVNYYKLWKFLELSECGFFLIIAFC